MVERVFLILFGFVLVGVVASGSLASRSASNFVDTESMAPTLDTGDGFVALHPALVREVRPRDVIVDEAA